MNAKLFADLYEKAGHGQELMSVYPDCNYTVRFIGLPIMYWQRIGGVGAGGKYRPADPFVTDYKTQTCDIPVGYKACKDLDAIEFDDNHVMPRFRSYVIDRRNESIKILSFSEDMFEHLVSWQNNNPAIGGQDGVDWIFRYENGKALMTDYRPTPFTNSESNAILSTCELRTLLDITRKHTPEEIAQCKAFEAKYSSAPDNSEISRLREQLYDIHAIPGHPNGPILLDRYKQLTGQAQPGFWIK
jgi:hypothetical protein